MNPPRPEKDFPPADAGATPEWLATVEPPPGRSRRQRLVILGVTVATVAGLWGLLLWQPGRAHWPRFIPVPNCSASAVAAAETGCVGGRQEVLLLPPSAAVDASLPPDDRQP
ncbi:hypothetical protein [Ideonella livida]|uniref:Uncharacterized protein n=1 Tax=Ideonella livida TaxID=2707176 RepID=A0A7C9PJ12_9BURK|nr:hypothetical protein [Ideonella livida]NDY93028.1 hypothetical protein [Ideonella livida]